MTQRITIGGEEWEIVTKPQQLTPESAHHVYLRKVEKPKESERLFQELRDYATLSGYSSCMVALLGMFEKYIIQRVREEVLK